MGLPLWMLCYGNEVLKLQRQLLQFTHALFQQGILDEHFTQLQQLQDESEPHFVVDVISLFFRDSEKLLCNMASLLEKEQVDYKKMDAHLHQFRGSSSSIGAQRVKNVCIAFRIFCEQQNRAGCLQCLHQLKTEYFLLKSKLQELFQLEERVLSAGGVLPMYVCENRQ